VVVEGKTINTGRHKSGLLRIEKKEEAELSVDTKTENGRLIYIRKDHTRQSRVSQLEPDADHYSRGKVPPQYGGWWGRWGL